MPCRLIQGQAPRSETLADVSAGAERLFWRLIAIVDDAGVYPSKAGEVIGACFPIHLERGTVGVEDVRGWLVELRDAGLIRTKVGHDGKMYLRLVTWARHQNPPNGFRSRYPVDFDGEPETHATVGLADAVSRQRPGRVYATKVAPAELPVRARTHEGTRADPRAPSGVSGIRNPVSDDPVSGSGASRRRGPRTTQPRLPDLPPVVARPPVPPELAGFDEKLVQGLGELYQPTTRFYDRMLRDYHGTGLDLIEQAEDMVEWLRRPANRGKRSDIPRFAIKWLDRSLDDLSRRRGRGGSRNGSGGAYNAGSGRAYGMGGPVSDAAREEARQLERAAERRAKGDAGD